MSETRFTPGQEARREMPRLHFIYLDGLLGGLGGGLFFGALAAWAQWTGPSLMVAAILFVGGMVLHHRNTKDMLR